MADEFGWGILGCGRMADRRMAPAFRACPGATLVACYSRDAAKAEAFATRHGIERAYCDLDKFVADPAILAVYIATPPAFHRIPACMLLDAGKHVLVDKPMACTAQDAGDMIDHVQAGATLGILHQQRFHPAIRQLASIARDGTLGRIRQIRIQIAMWLNTDSAWRFDPAIAGGGAAMDLGPHAIDILLALLGKPIRVTARIANLHRVAPVEDFCAATIEFSGDAVGLIDLGFCARAYGGRIEAFGDRGTFISDGCMQQAAEFTTRLQIGDDPTPTKTHVYDGGCFVDAITDFMNAVNTNRRPASSGLDGLTVMKVIEAIYTSAKQGRTVEI